MRRHRQGEPACEAHPDGADPRAAAALVLASGQGPQPLDHGRRAVRRPRRELPADAQRHERPTPYAVVPKRPPATGSLPGVPNRCGITAVHPMSATRRAKAATLGVMPGTSAITMTAGPVPLRNTVAACRRDRTRPARSRPGRRRPSAPCCQLCQTAWPTASPSPGVPPEWGGGRAWERPSEGRADRRRRRAPRRRRHGRCRRRAEQGRRAGAGPTARVVAASVDRGAPVDASRRPPPTTIPKTTIAQPFSKGMAGDEVTRLQQRLQALGFQPGPIDGQFGDLTQMAVWAYQKLVMGVGFNDPDGIVTPEMWLALQDPLPVHARRPDAGQHTEIYLPKQVLVVFDGDTPVFISHIVERRARGARRRLHEGQEWCEEVTIDPGENGNETAPSRSRRACAATPGRRRASTRSTARSRASARAASAGCSTPSTSTTASPSTGPTTCRCEPASHGCIRIPNLISPTFFNLVITASRCSC